MRVFEKSGDPKDLFKRSKRFRIADEVSNITGVAVSPSEDSLACCLASGQAYTLSLGSTDLVKVRARLGTPRTLPVPLRVRCVCAVHALCVRCVCELLRLFTAFAATLILFVYRSIASTDNCA